MKYIILYLASVLVSASLLGYAAGSDELFKEGVTDDEKWEVIITGSVVSPLGIIIGSSRIAYSLAKGK